MKRYILPFLMVSALFANEVKTLEIYPNTIFLTTTQEAKSGQMVIQIPKFVTSKNLYIQSSCTIENSQISENKTKNSFEQKLQTLEDKKERLLHQQQMLNAQKDILKLFQKNVTDFTNIQQDMKNFKKMYLENLNESDKIKKALKNIDKDIDDFTHTNAQIATNELKLNLSCKNNAYIKLTYNTPDIKEHILANFNASTEDKKLDIKQQIFLSHPYGDFLQNVDLRLYSTPYNANIQPPEFYPDYLKDRSSFKNKIISKAMPVADSAYKEISNSKELSTNQIWEVKNVNLKPFEENKIVFNQQKIDASFDNVIDGYANVKAYLKCEFTPKEYVMPGESVFSLDGMMIGEKFTDELIKNDKTHLYFGQNNFIQIQKELLQKMKDKSLFGGSKTTKTLWQYTIKNQNSKPQNITLIERLPISQDSDIKVKQIGSLETKNISKKGEVKSNFIIMPHEEKVFDYGYEIEHPND